MPGGSDEGPPAMLREGFGLAHRTRPEHLTAFITPEADLFSVRHLGIPDVSPGSWTRRIGGLVTRELTLSLDDLRGMPQTEITSVHECTGSPLAPAVPQRRVGHVRWTGVRLGELLGIAGLEDGAAHVISTGVDHGVYDGAHHERYERDLPLAKALDGSVGGDPTRPAAPQPRAPAHRLRGPGSLTRRTAPLPVRSMIIGSLILLALS
ncbi:molybdopterin-dependent oxidoreductase [Streptomyces sp. CG1]|uniref:molybdopterin-dependent oxidoreductase n=1 Tax=Streptomyces sp. CG1 TaxID=1287523 RepID=UPI0034E208E0